MADYRQFCGTCKEEVGFGGHAKGCPVPAQVAAAQAEREWERQQEKAEKEAEFTILSDTELVEAAVAAKREAEEKYKEYRPFEERSESALEVIRNRSLISEYLLAEQERRAEERKKAT